MDKQLTRICIVCGIFYYLSCIIYLQHIGMPPITIGFMWIIPFAIGFFFALNDKGIKTNLFSEIKDDFTSPTYKLEKSHWGEDVVVKYITEYSVWDDDWCAFFPFLYLFRFRQYYPENSVYVNKIEYQSILDGKCSPEEMYLSIRHQLDREAYKEMSAKKTEKEKLREVNKEYYNNFKTK